MKFGDFCEQCPSEYKNINGKCVGYECLDWDSEKYVCNQCYPNFSIRNGLCVSDWCLMFEDVPGFVRRQCTSCIQGYNPYDVHCIPVGCETFTYDL